MNSVPQTKLIIIVKRYRYGLLLSTSVEIELLNSNCRSGMYSSETSNAPSLLSADAFPVTFSVVLIPTRDRLTVVEPVAARRRDPSRANKAQIGASFIEERRALIHAASIRIFWGLLPKRAAHNNTIYDENEGS